MRKHMGRPFLSVASVVFILLTVGCQKQPAAGDEELEGGDIGAVDVGPGVGPILLATLLCPDTHIINYSRVCGSNANDAETKAENAASPNYACAAGCRKIVNGLAGPRGNQCALVISPPTFGNEFDVRVRIDCL